MTQQAGTLPYLSIPGGSSLVATVPAVLDNTCCKVHHSLFVITSAGVASGVVTLELSNDGVNWAVTTITTPALGASLAYMVGTGATPMPAQFVRANITTVIGGGTITAYVASA